DLAEGGGACDLRYKGYHLRRSMGASIGLAEYRRPFPSQAQELARLLGVQSSFSLTAVHAVHLPGQVKAGDRLDDFELLALIGQGAFAQVFLARQQSLQRLVALKVSADRGRSEEHTSELQSRFDLVCRLLLEK